MESGHQRKLPRRTSDHNVATVEEQDNNNDSDEEECVNTNVALLTFDVVAMILKNLNARDLCSAAKVCSCWNEAAQNEKRMRSTGVVTWSGPCEDSWDDANRFARSLVTRPMFSLMFTRPFDESHPATRENRADCPCRTLPSGCVNITVGNHGVVDENNEIEDEPDEATWLILSENKDVTIETICYPIVTDKKMIKRYDRIAQKQLDDAKIKKNKAKCFILLTYEDFSLASKILSNVPRDRQRTVSGGVVSNLSVCKYDENEKMCGQPLMWIGIMISGSSVRSWTIVLERRCDTKDRVFDQLKRLKDKVCLKKHSMGFMFACRGRGEYMLGEKNVESTAFKKLFPKVPLIGGFGEGEFGDSTVGEFCDGRLPNVTSPSILDRIHDRHLRSLNQRPSCVIPLSFKTF